MQYVDRTLEKAILRANDRFKVIMVSGMRQVGKSTLLGHIGNRTSVTLDNYRALDIASRMPEVFFQQYPAPVLVDEIQRAPNLFLAIKKFVDQHEERGLVWLTGSQRFELLKNTSESLAGRVVNFELLPFSLHEWQGKAFEQQPYLPSLNIKPRVLDSMSVDALWHHIWQGAWGIT